MPRAICLSGSSRFIDIMATRAWEFEKEGNVTLSCHLLPEWYGAELHHQAEVEGVEETLDYVHMRKIEMADELYVIDVNEYVGDQVKKEIEYAKRLRKPVNYLSKEPDYLDRMALIGSLRMALAKVRHGK